LEKTLFEKKHEFQVTRATKIGRMPCLQSDDDFTNFVFFHGKYENSRTKPFRSRIAFCESGYHKIFVSEILKYALKSFCGVKME